MDRGPRPHCIGAPIDSCSRLALGTSLHRKLSMEHSSFFSKARREQKHGGVKPAGTLIGAAIVLALTCGMASAGCSSKAGAGAAGSSNAGGSGGSGMVGSVTTLNESKPLGSLSPMDAAELCSDTYAYFGRGISQSTLCKWAGLTYGVSSSAPSDSQLEQNCASQEAMCLQAGAAAPSCSPIPAGCTATVAQYNACIADEVT